MSKRRWRAPYGWLGQGPRILWRAALVGLIAFAAGSVGWISVRDESFPAAHLEPSTESLAVGEVWIQSDLRVTVTVRNQSSRTIVIRDCEVSDSSVRVVPTSLTIPARVAARIGLEIDMPALLSGVEPALDDEPRRFEVRLRPVTNLGRAPLPWRVHGIARPVARGLPTTVDFGSPLFEGITPPEQDINIELHESVSWLSAESSSPHIVVGVLLPPGEGERESRRRILRVTPQPNLSAMSLS